MSDEAIVVCTSVMSGIVPTAGSVKFGCDTCGCLVWLSELGQSFVGNNPDAHLRCTSCVGQLDIRPEDLASLPDEYEAFTEWLEGHRSQIADYLKEQADRRA